MLNIENIFNIINSLSITYSKIIFLYYLFTFLIILYIDNMLKYAKIIYN